MQKAVSCFVLGGLIFFSFFFFFLHQQASLYTFLFVCVYACVCLRLRMLDVSLPVMMHQHVDNFFKQVRLLWAKEASSNLVNGLFQLRQAVVVLLSVVSKQDRKMKKKKIHTIRD